MKPIEGINLEEETNAVRDAILAERRADVRKQIRGIYADIHRWRYEIVNAERLIKKRGEQIGKAEAKLGRIEGGDWSLLVDEKSGEKSDEKGEGDDEPAHPARR